MEDSSLTLSTCIVGVETMTEFVAVTLSGELDMAVADQVADVLTHAVESGVPLVRLLLADLKFADSSAIKAILIGAQSADEHGVRFELVNPRGLVQRLLEVTGLIDALTVVQEHQAEP